MEKPRQGWAGLFNISFGFFGIQIGFALQNANMSRIFQTLGESLDNLPALWIAAPLTGLLVQPVIGHFSDRTWLGRLGRRRPYFLAGAVLAALSLFLMPLAEHLIFAAIMLWLLDASLNISMEPFRAFVGDMLRKDQHTAGYAVQTAFIGVGAVAGSMFPWALTSLGVANEAAPGVVPDTVRWSFWAGGAALFLAVLWTIVTTREYSPAELAAFDGEAEAAAQPVRALSDRSIAAPLAWIGAGAAVIAAVQAFALEKEMFLLGGLLIGYGIASIAAILLARNGRDQHMLASIVGDFAGMPDIMKRLALVQFFSWSALFIMWIYTAPVVAANYFGATDTSGAAFNAGGNWAGVLFAIYNGIAAVAALTFLPLLARRVGRVRTHIIALLAGAAGFAGFLFITDHRWLIVSEIGIGIAWASILAMPYAILASALPQQKLGIYMGLFNVFVVIPQLLVATVMGTIMKVFFPDQPVWTMAFAAGVFVLAALAMLRVPEPEGH
ncbi:MFS transporter [Sphingomonas sp. BGYR3]|uniref:MFS transporter n=1 Tax=Sphingomonas sp. BGYR3 TaxID=2975483 RepID=UPI0021A55C84|nr:MFS transporter [Sphingomonas sp. BGYR3]MDG5487046.1 MFS transporter [Sphingomonas sp. BGYR3]